MAVTTRVRGWAPWAPHGKSQDLLDNVQAVLVEYQAYLPMTIRQVFYRLVIKSQIEKTERGYKQLCELINRARRSEKIAMAQIHDPGFVWREPKVMAGHADVLATWDYDLRHRQLDRQEGQPQRLAFWLEAQGIVNIVDKIARRYGISVHSSGGFDSLSSKAVMAEHMSGENYEVLHLGDYDPSGVHIFSSLAEDINALGDDDIAFTRLAVTESQIQRWDLPTAPPKASDKRSFDDYRTVQLEAIAPDVLQQFLIDEIEARLDMETYHEVLIEEERARAPLLDTLRGISAMVK